MADNLAFTQPKTPSISFPKSIIYQTTPGRPIVNANHCPTEHISGSVDFFSNPFVKDLPSYVKDTTDFVKKIQSIPPLNTNILLVTLNVTFLYTNIPNKEALSVIYKVLRTKRPDTREPLSNHDIVQMLKLVLTFHNFESTISTF